MPNGIFVACGLILLIVMASIASPFWRRDPHDALVMDHKAEEDQELADLTVEREVLSQSLQELEVELAQARLEPEDYQRLKATDERRLLTVLDRFEELTGIIAQSETTTAPSSITTSPWVVAVIPSLLVILLSCGIYGLLQWQAMQKIVALQQQIGTQEGPNPLEMVARLEKRLREDPNNLDGQIMAGRSYMALQRIDDAQKAWAKVLEMDPLNNEANFHIGVILVESRKFDDPQLFEIALKHFEQVLVDLPNQPGANWYKGLALWYLERYRETEDAWALAFKNLDPGSQDADFVKAAMEKLRAGETPF